MDYYSHKLSGERLQRVYEIAPPRVRQYLEAEIEHVRARLHALAGAAEGVDGVLELGCGYGRVVFELVPHAHRAVGIDSADESIKLANELLQDLPTEVAARCEFLNMDALHLRFPDNSFDAVVCVQNGICAFRVDQVLLIREALRVMKPGGKLLFSTYTDAFWPERLAWFEAQAAAELLGPIDYEASRDGVIACVDGFCSGRLTTVEFRDLCERVGCKCVLSEVDDSSLFCEIVKQD